MDLLRKDAKRQMSKYGKIVQFSNYSIAWYTGWNSTLCGPCANDAIQEYLKHKDDEDYGSFCAEELPQDCGTIEEGPPVLCDECNREIFGGYEQCVKCKEWESGDLQVWSESDEGMICLHGCGFRQCKKCEKWVHKDHIGWSWADSGLVCTGCSE